MATRSSCGGAERIDRDGVARGRPRLVQGSHPYDVIVDHIEAAVPAGSS